ncbi:MAG: hypothetical protein QNJ31_02920 [Candidatus Caenarcaniphilales bacterium]|nr:hypothetical protein [Candidatus Caenarcaniphilales bacterium]
MLKTTSMSFNKNEYYKNEHGLLKAFKQKSLKIKIIFLISFLFIQTISLIDVHAEQKDLNIVYIHGAMNSQPFREKRYPKEGELLHKAVVNELGSVVPLSYYAELKPSYFYWGDILRDDARTFGDYPLKQTLRKSKGKINSTLKEGLLPVVYDAEWLQDQDKLKLVLNRLNKQINDENDPFILMAHSAGTLVAYDYLSRRLSLFEARKLITNKYKLDEKLSEQIPKYTCKDLLNQYNPQITDFASEEINFLKDAFNNIAIDLVEEEIEYAKQLVESSVNSYEEKHNEIKFNAKSSICIALLPKLKERLNRKKEIKELINSKTLFYDSLVFAMEEQKSMINELTNLIINLQKAIELQGASSGFLHDEETSLVEHLQFLLVSEKKTLDAIEKILNTKPGIFSVWAREYTKSIVDSFVKDHKKLCVDPNKFVGFVSFGSPIPLFRSQQIKLFSETGSATNLLFNHIYKNGKFWVHFNHAEDPIAVSIPDDLFMKHVTHLGPIEGKAGLIVDATSRENGVSLLKCRGPQAAKCPHNWYWFFPNDFSSDLRRILKNHYQNGS